MPNPPGTTITTSAAAATGPPGPRSATAFFTGPATRGVIGKALPVSSITEFVAVCGSRQPGSLLYDAVDVAIREGVPLLYVSRVADPAAAAATLILKDGAATPLSTLTVNANSPGPWGNSVSVQVIAGTVTNTYQLLITYLGALVESSPNLTSPADAVTWSAVSNYVTVVNDSSATAAPLNNPAVIAATALSGGVDNWANITETQWTNALTAFPAELGPGQVAAPGRTTTAAYAALTVHANTNNRTALLDVADNPAAANLVSQAQTAQLSGDPSFDAMFGPWTLAPGIPTGTSLPAPNRVVPPSALVAGLVARSDINTGNQNRAAAGSNGVARYCVGVTQSYVPADRGTLNNAGVNVIRSLNGGVELYGFRTLSLDPAWVQLSSQRLRMAIVDDSRQISDAVALFGQIDGKGHYFAQFGGALSGMLQGYWSLGAIFGATASAAYTVDVSSAVNTPTTIAAGQANANIAVRMSPFAEFVNIAITKVPVTQSL